MKLQHCRDQATTFRPSRITIFEGNLNITEAPVVFVGGRCVAYRSSAIIRVVNFYSAREIRPIDNRGIRTLKIYFLSR
jgi:hypothetical protein